MVMRYAFSASLLIGGTTSASTVIPSSQLPAFLTGNGSTDILRGSQILRYPKLAAIVGIRSPSDTISAGEFVSRIDKHLTAQESFFASMDVNNDGKLTIHEVAKKAGKMAVYFKYLDLNGDGVVTFDEFVSSRILFKAPESTETHGKSISVNVDATIDGLATSHRSAHSNALAAEKASDDLAYRSEDFYMLENSRLEAFFAADHHKDDPVIVEPVVITGSNYQSSSGFYPVYGMWVDNQLAFDAGTTALPDGALCRAACWALGGAVCAAVSSACDVGTGITVGGLAIPCTAVIIAACAASGGAASVCSDICS